MAKWKFARCGIFTKKSVWFACNVCRKLDNFLGICENVLLNEESNANNNSYFNWTMYYITNYNCWSNKNATLAGRLIILWTYVVGVYMKSGFWVNSFNNEDLERVTFKSCKNNSVVLSNLVDRLADPEVDQFRDLLWITIVTLLYTQLNPLVLNQSYIVKKKVCWQQHVHKISENYQLKHTRCVLAGETRSYIINREFAIFNYRCTLK